MRKSVFRKTQTESQDFQDHSLIHPVYPVIPSFVVIVFPYSRCPKESSVSQDKFSVRHPRESGDPGVCERRKGEKNGERGIEPATPRLWVPACAGMTENGVSQQRKGFADSFWQRV
jgi:hypothetical protein